MVKGLNVFKEKFSDYSEHYVLIGGVASYLVMRDAGLNFRTTKDFDVVLIVEALNKEFGIIFWDFINEGGYSVREKSVERPTFYRFMKPTDKSYPEMIELFSKRDVDLFVDQSNTFGKIHFDDEVASLSAILLDEVYYDYLLSGMIEIDEVNVLSDTHLIPFKIKAWLDLKERKEKGERVDSSVIKKHKNDICRLQQLLIPNCKVELPKQIKEDMRLFIEKMHVEEIDLVSLNVEGTKKEILEDLATYYYVSEELVH